MSTAPDLDRRVSGEREIRLGGQRIDLIDRLQLLRAVECALDGHRAPLLLASANLDHIYRFDGDADLFDRQARSQWLVLLDGMPLVWTTRRRTRRDWEQLAGSDLLPAMLDICERRDARVAFVGGNDELVRLLPAALAEGWPELSVTGHWTPSRAVVEDPEASAALATEVADAGVEFLVVGLGKPRQERWMALYAETTGARVTAAFGASTEFVAGVQERAPKAFSKLGAEWVYRLYKEPRRLGRRYLAEGPVALVKVIGNR